MSELKVSIDRLKATGNELSGVESALAGSASRINSVKSNLGFEMKHQAQIRAALSGISKSLENYKSSTGNMKSALENIATAYQRTESKLAGKDIGDAGTSGGSGDSGGESGSFVDDIKKWFGNVKKATVDCVNYVVKDFQNKGWTYTAFQYGKAAAKLVGGITAVFAIAGSGGVLAPIALVFAANNISSGMSDLGAITGRILTGQNADIKETNVLKDVLTESGRGIGRALGNEKLGENIGEGIYNTGNILSSVYSIGQGYNKLHEYFKENPGVVKGAWDLAAHTDLKDLRLQNALYKMEYPKATKCIPLAAKFVSKFTGSPKDIATNIMSGKGKVFGGAIGKSRDFVHDALT